MGPVVTIDGPAGAGKTSTALEIARRLGFRHLDSGALYRGLTFALLDAGIPEETWGELSVGALRALDVTLEPTDAGFDVRIGKRVLGDELRSAEVTSRVSMLAELPAARASLIDLQRGVGARGRLVADGRDMGSVVFPDAELKVYLVADLEERARRRLLEGGRDPPDAVRLTAEATAISQRDERDSDREISPLRRPPDAVEIDTTTLSFEEQVATIVELVGELTLP